MFEDHNWVGQVSVFGENRTDIFLAFRLVARRTI